MAPTGGDGIAVHLTTALRFIYVQKVIHVPLEILDILSMIINKQVTHVLSINIRYKNKKIAFKTKCMI